MLEPLTVPPGFHVIDGTVDMLPLDCHLYCSDPWKVLNGTTFAIRYTTCWYHPLHYIHIPNQPYSLAVIHLFTNSNILPCAQVIKMPCKQQTQAHVGIQQLSFFTTYHSILEGIYGPLLHVHSLELWLLLPPFNSGVTTKHQSNKLPKLPHPGKWFSQMQISCWLC